MCKQEVNHIQSSKPCCCPPLPCATQVIEVVSGDCLVIKDSATGVERRVQLSRYVHACHSPHFYTTTP